MQDGIQKLIPWRYDLFSVMIVNKTQGQLPAQQELIDCGVEISHS